MLSKDTLVVLVMSILLLQNKPTCKLDINMLLDQKTVFLGTLRLIPSNLDWNAI